MYIIILLRSCRYTYVALVAMTLVTCLVFISGLDGARFTFTLMLYQRIFGAMITLAHLSIAVQVLTHNHCIIKMVIRSH